MTRIRVVTSADVGLTANRFSATLLAVPKSAKDGRALSPLTYDLCW